MDRVIIRDIKGGIAEPFRLDSLLLFFMALSPFWDSVSLFLLFLGLLCLAQWRGTREGDVDQL